MIEYATVCSYRNRCIADNDREQSLRCAELDRDHILLATSLAHDVSVLDHIRIDRKSAVHSVVEIIDTVSTFLAGRSIQNASAELVSKFHYSKFFPS